MKRLSVLLFAWVLLLSLVTANADAADACSSPVDYRPMPALLAASNTIGGIGGTGHQPDGNTIGGIGGTGLKPGTSTDISSTGGIGGTGRAADPGDGGGIGGTGIIGTITGFASICVNGLEVHFEDSVPVSDNGMPSQSSKLAIGQMVVVEAGNSARGLEAKRIAVVHALEGPVTRARGTGDQLEVMGARVSLGSDLARQQANDLKVGDWVQVSGHPAADGAVLASRVGRIDARSEASVSGRSDAATGQVGGVPVDRRANGELTVRGKWDGKQLNIRESRPAAGTEWTQRPARVVIETRIRQADGKSIRTGRADVDAALGEQAAREKLSPGTLIRMTARIDADGRLRPIRIERAERDRRDLRDSAEPNGKSRGNDDGSENRSGKEINNRNKPLKAESDEKSERKDRNESERVERSEKAERAEKAERSEKAEKADRADRIERSERTERIERPERLERDH